MIIRLLLWSGFMQYLKNLVLKIFQLGIYLAVPYRGFPNKQSQKRKGEIF